MKDYLAKDIRNIAVLGHGSEGKTTLVESTLQGCGEGQEDLRVCPKGRGEIFENGEGTGSSD